MTMFGQLECLSGGYVTPAKPFKFSCGTFAGMSDEKVLSFLPGLLN